VDEPDSAAVRRRAEAFGEVHCAALGRVEVPSAFHRKLREGAFREAAYREVVAQFDDDCARGLWTWIPVNSVVLTATVGLIRDAPKSMFLRAADAIHLACARASGFTEVYTSDRHMTAAAPHFRLQAVAIARR
jgi:predicted nucleic acid-binding protein